MIGALCVTAALYGCGNNPVNGTVNGIEAVNPADAIDKPFETLGTTDTSVAFSDADISGTDEDASSPTLGKPEADETVHMEAVGTSTDLVCASSTPLETYGIRVRWGIFERQVKGDVSATTSMDWSGSLAVTGGQLSLIRTILFEDQGTSSDRDHVLDPTNATTTISFVSHTKTRHDGLLVKYQRCNANTTDTLTFSAPNLLPAPFSKTWGLLDLVKLNEVDKDVDANHDIFQIQSLKRGDQCEAGKGTINGVWFKVTDRFGQIKGRVVSAEGNPVGHIKGFYSVQADENGNHKLVAKFITHEGKFKGILIGTSTNDGTFSADAFNGGGVKVGTVTGKYVEGDANHKGTFSAIYELDCPAPIVPVGPSGGVDPKAIPVGDGKLTTTTPAIGFLYVCSIPTSPSLPGKAPWISADGTTWDQTAKPSVSGSVAWTSVFDVMVHEGMHHNISGNGLPNHNTGTFPIAISDPVYQFDKNPNAIATSTMAWQLPLAPVVASIPTCTHLGAMGVLLSGARLFNASDADGRDAVAHEVQDACDGHPQRVGIYHYHALSRCNGQTDVAGQHSPLVGFIADGFGLFGNQGEGGVALTNADLDLCHGHTHAVTIDGGSVVSYHYHATKEFPYTVGCFRGNPVIIQ